jgi:WD40 repeat protein
LELAKIHEIFKGKSSVINLVKNQGISTHFSTDIAATGSFNDKTMYLWDLSTGTEKAEYRHNNPVVSIKFLPGGNQILSACFDGSIFLWDCSEFRK